MKQIHYLPLAPGFSAIQAHSSLFGIKRSTVRDFWR